MDEPRLGEQFLRGRLVVRLGGRREVRIDEDALAVAMAAARMDREAFEAEEELDLVLGDLDAQLLVPVDVRGAVVVALDAHVAVRVRSEEHTSELQSPYDLVCRLLLEKKKKTKKTVILLVTR